MSEIRYAAIDMAAVVFSSLICWLPVWQSGLVEDPVDAGLLCVSFSCYAVVVALIMGEE
jgi:hypothetical protein